MGTIADKLKRLLTTKTDMAAALQQKGIDTANLPLDEYAAKIEAITGTPVEPVTMSVKYSKHPQSMASSMYILFFYVAPVQTALKRATVMANIKTGGTASITAVKGDPMVIPYGYTYVIKLNGGEAVELRDYKLTVDSNTQCLLFTPLVSGLEVLVG